MSFIGAILEFFHARKYLAELLLIGVISAAIYLGCNHLIQVGVGQERARWEAKLAAQQKAAGIETARLQERATIAEKAREAEKADNDQYRRDHPLTGRVRVCPANGVSQAASANGSDAGPTSAPELGLTVSAANSDQRYDRGALSDAFAALFDDTSGTLRQWQARGVP